MMTVKCPDCNGEGVSRGFGCPGFRPIEIPCLMCKGKKEITEEQLQWIKDGEAMRLDRRARDMSVREEAKRLGIKASDLSLMEMGMIKPVRNSSGGK